MTSKRQSLGKGLDALLGISEDAEGLQDEAVFDPRPGQGAAFTKQIEINKGDTLVSKAFPIL